MKLFCLDGPYVLSTINKSNGYFGDIKNIKSFNIYKTFPNDRVSVLIN